MFTVKHIGIGGDETLYESVEPQYVPADAKAEAPAHDSLYLDGRFVDGGREVTGGTVFVMNERGKTVARYDLGASPVPLGADVDRWREQVGESNAIVKGGLGIMTAHEILAQRGLNMASSVGVSR